MTPKEAKEQGYTRAMREDDDFCTSLDHLEPEDIESEKYIICQKEPRFAIQITEKDFKEILLEHLERQEEETGFGEIMDDLDTAINEQTFTGEVERINSIIGQVKVWDLTDDLIPLTNV